MALKASAHSVLVRPTGDNDEIERGALLIVKNDNPKHKIFRGVVMHVGAHVVEDMAVGNLVHYGSYYELGEHHVVPDNQIIAYEDDE